jgi:hypothetical protein
MRRCKEEILGKINKIAILNGGAVSLRIGN